MSAEITTKRRKDKKKRKGKTRISHSTITSVWRPALFKRVTFVVCTVERMGSFCVPIGFRSQSKRGQGSYLYGGLTWNVASAVWGTRPGTLPSVRQSRDLGLHGAHVDGRRRAGPERERKANKKKRNPPRKSILCVLATFAAQLEALQQEEYRDERTHLSLAGDADDADDSAPIAATGSCARDDRVACVCGRVQGRCYACPKAMSGGPQRPARVRPAPPGPYIFCARRVGVVHHTNDTVSRQRNVGVSLEMANRIQCPPPP